MKIVLAGGGSGGHFYPLIAVAEALNQIAEEEKLVDLQLHYLADKPYDPRMLFENHITFKKIWAGKLRRYFSIWNLFDGIKTGMGLFRSVISLYRIYPDVVFVKGGYPAFPIAFAAGLLRIPVVVHETDSVPGRTNTYAAKFARYIGISFGGVAKYFDHEKTALVGNPIRKRMLVPLKDGAYEFLDLEKDIPVILVTGGSQGAKILNDMVLDALSELLDEFQVIHQTGPENIEDAIARSTYLLKDHPNAQHYKLYPYLDETAQRMAAGIASLVISRAGGAIFEFAAWGIPSILIPITDSNGNHQRENAYEYARTGAAIVIEESNATPSILRSEVEHILRDNNLRARMSAAARSFAKPEAARLMAQAIIRIALEHEQQ
ncbi:MAG: UDP-N-acetylglucosamine--N-acetylmuramyl-(pentapeptide) pyrophosphoryl-undecaprenol N-acetylglucosamine transferase [bacterium]|nr:UDP-N-acetylglucosamine--N-acetylmuramyl-(pentapeptide) pyrophosphoryl-undecaprenol N-acetylglucosamine transferase [bacterium]